jgi:hypothetical protein
MSELSFILAAGIAVISWQISYAKDALEKIGNELEKIRKLNEVDKK